jgi:hypothetical protein
MTQRNHLGVVVFTLCALNTMIPLNAQSPKQGECEGRPYPPISKPCTTAAPCVNEVKSPVLNNPNDFQVTFAGIICIGGGSEARPTKSLKRQAMMIHGNWFTKRHTPMLGVHNADKASLRWASGQSVECDDHTYCWTPIIGLRLRIVGDKNSPPLGAAVYEDISFCDLVPRLGDLLPNQKLRYTEMCGDDYEGLPRGAVDGCFDIEGGILIANPFKSFQQGMFVFADGHQSDPVQFADVVRWHGQTSGNARLQIRSAANGNEWKDVTILGSEPLLVAAVNLGHAHHTTAHFVLNEKIYGHLSSHLPTIMADGVPPCNPAKVYCYTGMTSLIDVAGCSNTRP